MKNETYSTYEEKTTRKAREYLANNQRYANDDAIHAIFYQKKLTS